MIRTTSLRDLDALAALENAAFAGDRLSRRGVRHLLTRGNALFLVDERDGILCGYVLLLFRTGAAVARLYSIAVAHAWRGRGVAAGMVRAAEQAATESRHTTLRLEVRRDNAASLALFRGLGYHGIGMRTNYYDDGVDALRLEKPLARPAAITEEP